MLHISSFWLKDIFFSISGYWKNYKDLGTLPHFNNELSDQFLKNEDLGYERSLSNLMSVCFKRKKIPTCFLEALDLHYCCTYRKTYWKKVYDENDFIKHYMLSFGRVEWIILDTHSIRFHETSWNRMNQSEIPKRRECHSHHLLNWNVWICFSRMSHFG